MDCVTVLWVTRPTWVSPGESQESAGLQTFSRLLGRVCFFGHLGCRQMCFSAVVGPETLLSCCPPCGGHSWAPGPCLHLQGQQQWVGRVPLTLGLSPPSSLSPSPAVSTLRSHETRPGTWSAAAPGRTPGAEETVSAEWSRTGDRGQEKDRCERPCLYLKC